MRESITRVFASATRRKDFYSVVTRYILIFFLVGCLAGTKSAHFAGRVYSSTVRLPPNEPIRFFSKPSYERRPSSQFS